MQKLKVEVVINSNLLKVWQHWNNTQSIMGWAFASPDWECPYAENDLRIGGRFLTRMKAKDGSAGFDFTGTYTEVVEFSKIKYKMDKLEQEDEHRECEVIFTDLGDDKTKVQEEFDPENLHSLDMQKSGWQSILENFKRYSEINYVSLTLK